MVCHALGFTLFGMDLFVLVQHAVVPLIQLDFTTL